MRLTQYISESSYRYIVETGKGFSRYKEMDENGLFIEKSGARKWHDKGHLLTTVYAYDGPDMIGWSSFKYDTTFSTKEIKMYGSITAGYVAVYVDEKYRGSGIAKELLLKLKNSIDFTTKTPVGKMMSKHKRLSWSIGIRHMNRIERLVKNVFNDKNEWGDDVYHFIDMGGKP